MTFIYFFALTLFILLSGILCIVILMQESKSMGLGSSFGGDSSDSMFGTATAEILKKFTAWLALIFFVSCVLLSLWTAGLERSKNRGPSFSIEQMER